MEGMANVVPPERARWTLPDGHNALIIAPDGHLLVVHAESVARWLETTKAALNAVRERDTEIDRLNACIGEQGRLALCGVISRVLGVDVGDMTTSGGDDTETLTESIVSGFRERDDKIKRLEKENVYYLRSAVQLEQMAEMTHTVISACPPMRDVCEAVSFLMDALEKLDELFTFCRRSELDTEIVGLRADTVSR